MNTARSSFRRDIHGLRAVAVGLVVLYHAGVPFLGGGYVGVDIFFVISGFLITSHLLTQLERNGRLDLASFYARRVRRILPVAFFVLVFAVIGSLVFLPPLRVWDAMRDAAASALYVPNVLFAYVGTDYLAETAPSPFQHFWSLGVEEQFYLFWPLVLWLVYRLTRGVGRRFSLVIGALVALSFALGLVLTTISQPWAFFSLPTRAWELGVGGLVALAVSRSFTPFSSAVNAVLGWLGLGLILGAGSLFDSSTLFPGYAALVPTVGAAMIIWSGSAHIQRPWGPIVVLGARPLQFVGTISYSMYLWHWPLLVIPAAASLTPLPIWTGLAIAALTVPLSWLSHRYIEEPAQKRGPLARARPRASLIAALVTSLVVASASLGSGVVSDARPLDSGRSAAPVSFSPQPSFSRSVPDNMVPSLRGAEQSNPAIYSDGCHLDYAATDVQNCVFGDPDSLETVALFGDSHAAQWFPALLDWADRVGVRLETYTKSACPSADVSTQLLGNVYSACAEWREKVTTKLAGEEVGLLILANYSRQEVLTSDDKSIADSWREGVESTISRIGAEKAAVIRDTPFMGTSPAICLSVHLDDSEQCSVRRAAAENPIVDRAETAAAAAVGAALIDVNDYLCSATVCGPIIGNVLLYRDAHHLTVEASRMLSEPLGQRLLSLTSG
ncbi:MULTISPECIES: acyltransferase family protein [unclassified Rathayibacter]|uniref:acyltransferase family protein n=1 Tax=unclassified Rathayibacter TaxID=2609250 RepID=UPI0010E65B9B|nr:MULTISPECIES: acyltransferase family protein [unclassified Rathayibacter]TCL84412.1 peptidoglycan/LPS O-acetylase OafA/YrhL [Rathayibacter sp. PhB192]TCM30130.1 peptidoglycan/LPS O-acetylase OafA/YrhL [Rathayibacter sp. PhB179]